MMFTKPTDEVRYHMGNENRGDLSALKIEETAKRSEQTVQGYLDNLFHVLMNNGKTFDESAKTLLILESVSYSSYTYKLNNWNITEEEYNNIVDHDSGFGKKIPNKNIIDALKDIPHVYIPVDKFVKNSLHGIGIESGFKGFMNKLDGVKVRFGNINFPKSKIKTSSSIYWCTYTFVIDGVETDKACIIDFQQSKVSNSVIESSGLYLLEVGIDGMFGNKMYAKIANSTSNISGINRNIVENVDKSIVINSIINHDKLL